MRIFSRKKFEFESRGVDPITGIPKVEGKVLIEAQEFKDVPEWVKSDPLFNWALIDGDIEVIENTTQQKILENDPNANTGKRGKKSDSTETPTDSQIPPAGDA